MKPEDKELLFKDLCARLPYGCRVPLFEWLADHIREEDAMDWKYDITDFNEIEE